MLQVVFQWAGVLEELAVVPNAVESCCIGAGDVDGQRFAYASAMVKQSTNFQASLFFVCNDSLTCLSCPGLCVCFAYLLSVADVLAYYI